MSEKEHIADRGSGCLLAAVLWPALSILAALAGVVIGIAWRIGPIAEGVVYVAIILGAVLFLVRLRIWRKSHPARYREDGAAAPSRASLINLACGCLWVPWLLPIFGLGLWAAPLVYSELLYEPPQIGETAEELRDRLGPPLCENLPDAGSSDGESGYLIYVAPNGLRYLLTLDEDGRVTKIDVFYR